MQALTYEGDGIKHLTGRPMPELREPTDAIVKIRKTTICGTDLHILKGDVCSCRPPRILGHEGTGIVAKLGSSVTGLHEGDAVLISCITACGRCEYCSRGMRSHCVTGGWILGNQIDGTQAEYVRIPHAGTSLYRIPPEIDDEALILLSDILPTGFECGVLSGKISPGSTVAIVGAGPIGLAALLTAQLYSPLQITMIDTDCKRLRIAQQLGATSVINAADGALRGRILAMTKGRGVDTAIEAVGVPASFLTCQEIIAPGGTIANIGVHGTKVDLHLEQLWSRNITITTSLVDTTTIPLLLEMIRAKKIDPSVLITHRFDFESICDAYDTFAHAPDTGALKIVIST